MSIRSIRSIIFENNKLKFVHQTYFYSIQGETWANSDWSAESVGPGQPGGQYPQAGGYAYHTHPRHGLGQPLLTAGVAENWRENHVQVYISIIFISIVPAATLVITP